MRWPAIGGAVFAVIVLTSCGTPPRKVVVPVRARQTDLAGAFDVLRAAGFRVTIANPTAVSSLRPAGVAWLSPSAGLRAASGSTVTIRAGFGPSGSPAVARAHPHYRVPSFAGKPLAAAVAWADAHDMFWSVPQLPPLTSSKAPHLYDGYRVVAQRPKPGETIVQGVMVGRGFRPTPLTLTVVPR